MNWEKNARILCETLTFSIPFLNNLKTLSITRMRLGDQMVPELVKSIKTA